MLKLEKNNCPTMSSTVKTAIRKRNLKNDHPVLVVRRQAAVVRVK